MTTDQGYYNVSDNCTCPDGGMVRHTEDCYYWDVVFDGWDNLTGATVGALVVSEASEPVQPASKSTQLDLETSGGGLWSGWEAPIQTPRWCQHCQDPYTLSDGTRVLLSSHYERAYRDIVPDLAVYFDGAWKPDCYAIHLGWRDYGLPTPARAVVLKVAAQVLEVARGGGAVEMGCLGAHGRTGTFLALLEVMVQPEGKRHGWQAINRVRDLHCAQAIESMEQEDYVCRIAAALDGREYASPTQKRGKKGSNKRNKRKG